VQLRAPDTGSARTARGHAASGQIAFRSPPDRFRVRSMVPVQSASAEPDHLVVYTALRSAQMLTIVLVKMTDIPENAAPAVLAWLRMASALERLPPPASSQVEQAAVDAGLARWLRGEMCFSRTDAGKLACDD
jgi:hypothetical protein